MQPEVVFVDDDANLREGIARMLRRERIAAVGAESAVACLDLLSQYPIKVVVSDLKMPNHNGLELLQHLFKNHRHIVRVVLSGTVDQKRALKAINECQVFRCLEKPCARDTLIDSIQSALDHYEELRQGERLLDVLRMQANFIRYQDERAQMQIEKELNLGEE